MLVIILALFGGLLAAAALFGARRTLLGLVAARPACDKSFEAIKALAGSANGPGAALNLLVIALAVLAVIHRPRALLAPPVLGWGAVLLATVAALAHSPDPASGVRLLLTLATYAAVAALPFALIDSADDAAACLKAALASSVIPAVIGIGELIAYPGILLGDDRLESTFTHPNILAFFLVGVLTLILFLLSSRAAPAPARWRPWLVSYGVLLLVLLLATKTRSAWIAMALILAVHALATDRRVLLGLLGLPVVLLVPGVGDRLLDLGGGNTNDAFATLNSFAWRQLLWAETWEWLRQNPPGLVGHGPDLYISYVPLFFSRGTNPEGVGAHNAILQIWFEMGLAGLSAFALVFACVLVPLALRLSADRPGMLLFLMLTFSHMLVAYSDNLLDYLQFQWFFWFTTGTVIMAARFAPQASRRMSPGQAPAPHAAARRQPAFAAHGR